MARRPLTDVQRNLLQQERSNRRFEVVKTQEVEAREQAHKQFRLETESELASQRSGRQLRSNVAQTVTPSSNSNLVMVVLFLMFGLIIIYDLVTKPAQIGSFLGGLGNWIAAISTNQPLFVNKAAATTSSIATPSSVSITPSSTAAGRTTSAQGTT
jgi:hypothetical protein